MSLDTLAIELNSEQRRVLQFIADVGLVGEAPEEVASYLVARGIDDMLRAKVLSLETVTAQAGRNAKR